MTSLAEVRSKKDVSNKVSELDNLYRSSIKFLVPLSKKDVFPIIVQEAKRLVGAKYCSIYLKEGRELVRVFASSEKLKVIQIRRVGYTWRSFVTGKAFVIQVKNIEKFHPEVKDMGIKSVIYIPLVYRKRSVGVLSADSFQTKQFTDKELNILKLFGTMAMLAIRKSQLHDDLEESLKNRDLFIALASHELRSPLTTINSYAQLIEKTLAKNELPDYKWSKILKDETTRMILMVDELLQLNMIKTGQLQYNWKPCNLQDILRRAIINFNAKHVGRKLIFEDQLEHIKGDVMADFNKLLQVFVNILNNAAKFSVGEIYMTFSFKKPNYLVKVEDKGEGVADIDKPYIFDGFYKGGRGTKEGIGLGLFLTKSIVEMHGGKVKLVSNFGKGTKVEIFLPKLHE